MRAVKGRVINGNLTLTGCQAEKIRQHVFCFLVFFAHSNKASSFPMFITFTAQSFKAVKNKNESCQSHKNLSIRNFIDTSNKNVLVILRHAISIGLKWILLIFVIRTNIINVRQSRYEASHVLRLRRLSLTKNTFFFS